MSVNDAKLPSLADKIQREAEEVKATKRGSKKKKRGISRTSKKLTKKKKYEKEDK